MILEIKDLCKSFGHKKATDHFTVTLENGVYGLLGPNGAGKTTIMRQITTLTKPDSGKIIYNGQPISNNEESYRAKIGYLPQDFGVYKNFTAQKFLEYIAVLKGLDKKKAKEKIANLLKLVGLIEVKNKKVGKFSGGMVRRVGIAQALLNDPEILIMDEPTAGLDPQERARFRNLISEISKEKIVILSTHIISDIESIAKETIIMKDGKLLVKGTHNEVLDKMEGKVFLVKANNENEIHEIQRKYKVVNLQRGKENTEIRIISENTPNLPNVESIAPRFEDVYMFYFELEDAKED